MLDEAVNAVRLYCGYLGCADEAGERAAFAVVFGGTAGIGAADDVEADAEEACLACPEALFTYLLAYGRRKFLVEC